jgi:hypothetical protein
MCLPKGWKCLTDKVTQLCSLTTFFIMSTELMISALRRGQTGSEILTILDALTGNTDSSNFDYVESPMIEQVLGVQPTLEIVEF